MERQEAADAIIRVAKGRQNPYVMVDKYPIAEDTSLSWKAKGLLVYCLSRPDDWMFRISDLQKRAADGRDSVYSGLRELERAGYLHRFRSKDAEGKWSHGVMLIFERPWRQLGYSEDDLKRMELDYNYRQVQLQLSIEAQSGGAPHTEKPHMAGDPHTAFPDTVFPDRENPTLLSIDSVPSTDSTELKGAAAPSPSQGSEAVPSTFQEWQELLKQGTNRPAILRRMHMTLFPGVAAPDFGRIGQVAKAVGGASVLAMKMWEVSVRPPVGNPLDYIQKAAATGAKQTAGAKRSGNQFTEDKMAEWYG